MDECFGTADFYSSNLAKLGHQAEEVICNCDPLQRQWAREHGLRLSPPLRLGRARFRGIPVPVVRPDRRWLDQVLLAQVKATRPDVVHIHDPVRTDPGLLRALRPFTRLITAQIASPIVRPVDWTFYDGVLSSFPHFVQRFHQQGVPSAYLKLGFEPGILERLCHGKPSAVAFVGGMTRSHQERIDFVESLARRLPIDWWGYGLENLRPESPLRAAYRGPAWGLEMYNTLYNARISLNHHIDTAENYANNMRLFEATGVGSFLLTDQKSNLADLFEPGKEVAAYRSVEECIELAEYYLSHEDERRAIAQAGQQRTLSEHSYYRCMQDFVALLDGYLARARSRTA